jgi:hypothetical protein
MLAADLEAIQQAKRRKDHSALQGCSGIPHQSVRGHFGRISIGAVCPD